MFFRAFLTVVALWAGPAAAQDLGFAPDDRRHTEVELVSEVSSIAPGEPFTVGLHMVPEEGWHTYWENPGDSGLPTTIDWRLPAGFSAGEIRYPTPEKVPFGPLMNYGYGKPNTLLVDITPPEGLAPGRYVGIEAKASWLVCDDEICVPEDGTYELSLEVGDGAADPLNAELFSQARHDLPIEAPWPARYHLSGENFTLALDLPAGADEVTEAWLFPRGDGVIPYAADQELKVEGERLLLMTAAGDEAPAGAVEGVVKLKTRDAPVAEGFAVAAEPSAAPLTEAGSGESALIGDINLFTAFLFAFLGGIILNAMPCVFPVLSLKALSLAKSGGDRAAARQSGVYYTLGILASFLIVGGLLLAVRAAGEEVGWGFQLQSPWVIALLAFVMFTVGLNLIGAFEIGGSLMSVGDKLTRGTGRAPAFWTGVLATLVATPCTAPFMATALGFALTQSAVVALTVFFALGLGLATPFLLLAFVPAMQRLMPKPGPWMETFKQFLAFPMFATALWLLWVVGIQAGQEAVLVVVGGFILIGFAVWALERSRKREDKGRRVWRTAALGALVLAAIAIWQVNYAAQLEAAVPAELEAEAFTPEKVTALRAKGEPVFVYFTAAWCITCKVNERIALETEEVKAGFDQAGVTVLEGDWTNRDEVIARTLRKYGRSGVPLYLFFPRGGGEAEILPQILTPEIVLNAISKA